MQVQVYTESTDGTSIEVKECALVWHYSDADPDFGAWQVRAHGSMHSKHIAAWKPACSFSMIKPAVMLLQACMS